MKKILLITSPREKGWLENTNNPTVSQLYDFTQTVANADPGVKLSITSLDRIEFTISNDIVRVFDNATGLDLSDYDGIHLRNASRSISFYADYAKAISLYVESRGKIVIDPDDIGSAFGKLSQGMLFALNGLPVPKTYAQWNGSDLSTFIKSEQVQMPVIAKASMGMKGADNYLVHTIEELGDILKSTEEPFVIQEVIPNNGDYRVLFLGKENPLTFWRPRIEGSHLSNTSQGSVPDKNVVLDQVALELAEKVRLITNRMCVGVDIMQNSETGSWVILEANSNPALASGAFNDEKAMRYAAMINDII